MTIHTGEHSTNAPGSVSPSSHQCFGIWGWSGISTRHRKESDIICSFLRCFLDFSTWSLKKLICKGSVSIPLRPHRTPQRAICVWGWLPKPEQGTEKPLHPGQWLKVLPIVPNQLPHHATTSTCCNKGHGCARSRQGESRRTSDDCIVVHFF